MKKTGFSRIALTVLLIIIGAMSAYAERTIKGTVSDESGPLIGVSVTLQDAKVPTAVVTDIDGNYTITVPGSKSRLLFSYVGFSPVMEIVGDRKVINVTMTEDMQVLDEVIVVGYGTVRKSHLTGSVAKIDGDKLTNAVGTDVTTALQGMMSGLNVNNETSEVGVTPSIRVRGTGSISAESEPLVIVDGFPISGGLSQIDANDIQSIEILKDAASAAIYGSRAANGVIMVTTKVGTPDKAKYTVKFNQGFKYAYKKHDMITSNQWLDLLTREESMGGPKVLAAARAAAYLESQCGATDWQEEGLRDLATMTTVKFNVSGGRKDTKYFISGGYTHDEGIMKQNAVDKVTFRSKLDTKLSTIATLGVNMSGTYNKTERPRNNYIDFYRTPSFLPVYHNEFTTALTGYTGFARGSHFNNIQTPTGPVDENGNPTMEKTSPFSTANNNPASVMANTERHSESFQGLASVYLIIDIAKGLQFKTSNGADVRYSPSYAYSNYGATKDGENSIGTFFSTLYVDLLTENTLTYTTSFGPNKAHKLDALLGFTAEKTRNQRVALTGTGFPNDDIHTLNAASEFVTAAEDNGNTDGTGTFRYPDNVLISYLGRVNYNYLGRYLLSASLRLDRSSLFAKGHRNAWFPSVSLGWRINEEPFMRDITTITNLKLRATYGVTGNNRIAYQAALEVLNAANYPTGAGNGALVNGSANTSDTLANSDITWEKTDEYNVGLDLGLWNNRFNLSIDAYTSVTRALLFAQPTQSFTGFNYFWNNIGKVRNSGIEFQLDTRNFVSRDFEWSTDFNISFTRNKLLEIGGEREMINQGERNECYIARVGDPLIQFYGYKTMGVWNSEEEIQANPHFAGDVPGGMRIVDTNGDGELTPDDRVALGNPYPDFTWGMTNNLRYRNFDASVLIQGVHGLDVFNGDVYYAETTKWNSKYIENRWVSAEHPGDGKTPYLQRGYNLCLTDYPIQDGSYVCLRNVTIGYTLPRSATKQMHINGLRFYVSGNNLCYIWKHGYKGINPESRYTSGAYKSAMISGYQRGGFPLTSTIMAGFDINF